MTLPSILPKISITQGVEYAQQYAISTSAGITDLTGWEGTFTLSSRPFEKPFYTAAVTLGGVAGTVNVVIPADDTLAFPVNPVLGGSPTAYWQIYLVSPTPTENQVWQGPAVIAGKF